MWIVWPPDCIVRAPVAIEISYERNIRTRPSHLNRKSRIPSAAARERVKSTITGPVNHHFAFSVTVEISRERGITDLPAILPRDLRTGVALHYIPAAKRGTVNREIGFAVAIIIRRYRNIARQAPLLDYGLTSAAQNNEPKAVRRAINGVIGLAVTVIISRNRNIAGKPPLLRH